jgi:hypothetical protein
MYKVHNPVPLIVGSSVGGLLLLAIITAILYKVRDLSFVQQDLILFPLQGEQEFMLESITSTHHVRKPSPPSFLSFVPPISKTPAHLSPFLFYSSLLCMSLTEEQSMSSGRGECCHKPQGWPGFWSFSV